MLGELYEYAVKSGLAAKPGYEKRKLKAYVCIDKNGAFVGVDPPPDTEVFRPCIGSAANGATKCNFPVEKRVIMLSADKPAKKKHYFDMLSYAADFEPKMQILQSALEDSETLEAINGGLDGAKIKPGDMISFKVDGTPVENTAPLWWDEYYKTVFRHENPESAKSRCFVTGKLETPTATVNKVSGLQRVGGHSSGDALISGDKQAFCSYGFQKAENAAVGEEAVSAVNAALEDLIRKGKVLAGAYWLHWYKEPVPDAEDILTDIWGDTSGEGADGEAEDEGADSEAADEDTGGEAADEGADGEAEDEDTDTVANEDTGEHPEEEAAADRLIESVYTGEKAASLESNIYYILSVSGANGRIAVRAWQTGSYSDLQKALNDWWADLSLVSPYGKGRMRNPALGKINYRLIKPSDSAKDLNKRMGDELAAFEPLLVLAVINDNPLPDRAAHGALRYIRSKMMKGSEDGNEVSPDGVACQVLKAWLVRKNREKGEYRMEPELTKEYPGKAYHCGRLAAVYAKIQKDALGKVGAGVVQRYYTSACASPALVFGTLSRLSQYHLSKIDSEGLVIYYEKMLSGIAEKIGCSFPATFSLKEQAEFALGYYHQNAELYSGKKEN